MEYIRKLMQGLKMARSDEEMGRRTSVYPMGAEGRPSTASGPDGRGFMSLEPSEKLVEFRLLVGITSDASFKAPRGFRTDQRPMVTVSGRPAPNIGIYMTVVDKEVKAKKNYKQFSILINSCLGLQLIVAAALTALGAANRSGSAITVFGAINTVIAGFLTFLKGSGLPNRLKYFQHEWDRVREYIEQRERDLICHDEAFDVPEQVEVIRRMYEEVKADVESNTPDRFVSAAGVRQPQSSEIRKPTNAPSLGSLNSSELLKGGDVAGSRFSSALNGGLNDIKAKYDANSEKVGDFEKDAVAHGNAAHNKTRDFGVRFFEEAMTLKTKVADKMKEIGELEKQIESHGKSVLHAKQADAHGKAREVAQMEKELEASGTTRVTEAFAAKDEEARRKLEEISHAQRELEERTRVLAERQADEARRGVQTVTAGAVQAGHDTVADGQRVLSDQESRAIRAAQEYLEKEHEGIDPKEKGPSL